MLPILAAYKIQSNGVSGLSPFSRISIRQHMRPGPNLQREVNPSPAGPIDMITKSESRRFGSTKAFLVILIFLIYLSSRHVVSGARKIRSPGHRKESEQLARSNSYHGHRSLFKRNLGLYVGHTHPGRVHLKRSKDDQPLHRHAKRGIENELANVNLNVFRGRGGGGSGVDIRVGLNKPKLGASKPQQSNATNSGKQLSLSKLESKLRASILFRRNIVAVFGYILTLPDNPLTHDQYTALYLIQQALILKRVYVYDILPVLSQLQGATKTNRFKLVLQSLERNIQPYLKCTCQFWLDNINQRGVDIEQLLGGANPSIDFLAGLTGGDINLAKTMIPGEPISPVDGTSLVREDSFGPIFDIIMNELKLNRLVLSQKLFAAILMSVPIAKVNPMLEESIAYVWEMARNNSLPNWSQVKVDFGKNELCTLIKSVLQVMLKAKGAPDCAINAIRYILLHSKEPPNTSVYHHYAEMQIVQKQEIDVPHLLSIIQDDADFPDMTHLRDLVVVYLENKVIDIGDILHGIQKYTYESPIDLLIAVLSKMQRYTDRDDVHDTISALLSNVVLKKNLDTLTFLVPDEIDISTLLFYLRGSLVNEPQSKVQKAVDVILNSHYSLLTEIQALIPWNDKAKCPWPSECLASVLTGLIRIVKLNQISFPKPILKAVKVLVKVLVEQNPKCDGTDNPYDSHEADSNEGRPYSHHGPPGSPDDIHDITYSGDDDSDNMSAPSLPVIDDDTSYYSDDSAAQPRDQDLTSDESSQEYTSSEEYMTKSPPSKQYVTQTPTRIPFTLESVYVPTEQSTEPQQPSVSLNPGQSVTSTVDSTEDSVSPDSPISNRPVNSVPDTDNDDSDNTSDNDNENSNNNGNFVTKYTRNPGTDTPDSTVPTSVPPVSLTPSTNPNTNDSESTTSDAQQNFSLTPTTDTSDNSDSNDFGNNTPGPNSFVSMTTTSNYPSDSNTDSGQTTASSYSTDSPTTQTSTTDNSSPSTNPPEGSTGSPDLSDNSEPDSDTDTDTDSDTDTDTNTNDNTNVNVNVNNSPAPAIDASTPPNTFGIPSSTQPGEIISTTTQTNSDSYQTITPVVSSNLTIKVTTITFPTAAPGSNDDQSGKLVPSSTLIPETTFNPERTSVAPGTTSAPISGGVSSEAPGPNDEAPVLPPTLQCDRQIFVVFPAGGSPPYVAPNKPEDTPDREHCLEFPPIQELFQEIDYNKPLDNTDLPNMPDILEPLRAELGLKFVSVILGTQIEKNQCPTKISLLSMILIRALEIPKIRANLLLSANISRYVQAIDYVSTTALFPVVVDSKNMQSNVIHVTIDLNNPTKYSLSSDRPDDIPKGFVSVSFFHPKYWLQQIDPQNPFCTLLPPPDDPKENSIPDMLCNGSFHDILGADFNPLLYPSRGNLMTAVLERLTESPRLSVNSSIMLSLIGYLKAIRAVALFSRVPREYFVHVVQFQQNNHANWQPDTASLILALPPARTEDELQDMNLILSFLQRPNLLTDLNIPLPTYATSRGKLLKMIFNAAISNKRIVLDARLLQVLKRYQGKIMMTGIGASPIIWVWVRLFVITEEVPLGEIIEAVIDYDKLPYNLKLVYNELMTYLSKNTGLLQSSNEFPFEKYRTKGSFLRALFQYLSKHPHMDKRVEKNMEQIIPYISLTGRGAEKMNHITIDDLTDAGFHNSKMSALIG